MSGAIPPLPLYELHGVHMGKKNWLLTFLVSYKNWLLAVRNLKSLKILLRKHERYRQDTKLIHNIASGMIMMMMMMMMMMMHISVNFCFFFFSEHSEENYENVELDGSNQSEIQSRYFPEYKPRPYCYIPCLSWAHRINAVIIWIQSDIPKSNFTTFFVTFH